MPSRVIKKSGASVIGSFPSIKLKMVVRYESTLERDYLYILEFDEDVLSYEMQPFTIYMTLEDGKTHRYTPDVKEIREGQMSIVEIKSSSLLNRESTIQQVTIGKRWAPENGYQFKLMTDIEIRQGEMLENLKITFRYARISIPYDIFIGLRKLFPAPDIAIPFFDIAKSLMPENPVRCKPFLWSLIFNHYLSTDLNKKLSDSSLLTLTVKEKCHGQDVI